MTVRIVLDAGHGGGKAHNRGALVGNEGDNNFRYTAQLKRKLERYEGAEVTLTRGEIHLDPSLKARGDKSDGVDLFISNHSNATGDENIQGSEIFVSVRDGDHELAEQIAVAIAPFFGNKNRGVKVRKNKNGTDYYAVLRHSDAKVRMLIEHGFHTNIHDAKAYVEQAEEIATVVADVIAKYYGRKLKVELEKNAHGNTVTTKPVTAKPNTTKPVTTAKPAQKASVKIDREYAESARFYPVYTMNVREQPSLKARIVAQYPKGSVIPSKENKYDKVVFADGHVWISYIGGSGKRRYVAVRPQNKPRGFWGWCR